MSVSYVAKKTGTRIERPSYEEAMQIKKPAFIEIETPAVVEWKPIVIQAPIVPLGKGLRLVERVTEADLEELISWTIGRFTDRWPNASAEGMAAYARMSLRDTRSAAFRTVHVWGIVVLEQEFWDPLPTARVKLIVSKKPSHREVVAVYKAMMEWALARRAYEFQIDENTDYNLEPIAKRLKASRRRTHYILDRAAMEAAHANDD